MSQPRRMYLGVDPGKKGGLCLLDEAGTIVLVRPMPICAKPSGSQRANKGKRANEEVDACALGDVIRKHYQGLQAVLVEHQRIFGQQLLAVGAQQHGYGMLCGAVLGLGVRLETTDPKIWKHTVGIAPKREGRTVSEQREHLKGLAIAKASELWPHEDWLATPRSKKPHDGMAEAALLAEVLRRRELGVGW